jgi:hypothetical protein
MSYPIADVGTDADETKRLRALRIRTSERLLEAAKNPKGRRQLDVLRVECTKCERKGRLSAGQSASAALSRAGYSLGIPALLARVSSTQSSFSPAIDPERIALFEKQVTLVAARDRIDLLLPAEGSKISEVIR